MKRLLSLVAIAFLLLITSAVFADDYSKDENLTLSVSFIEQGLDVSLEGWRTDPTDQSKFFVKEQYYAEDRNGDGVVDSVQHLSVKRSGVFLTYYVHSNVVQEKFPKHTFFDKEVGDIPDNRIVKVKRCRQQYVCVNSFNVYKNFFQNTKYFKGVIIF